jgi:hypothetical protein
MLIGAMVGGLCVTAAAQSPASSTGGSRTAAPAAPATVESAFWDCDAMASAHLVDPGTAAHCSVITEELRRGRFNGDFDAMLAWWRLGKVAAQDAIAAGAESRGAPAGTGSVVHVQHAGAADGSHGGAAASLESSRARLNAMSADAIKTLYGQCSQEAIERRLGGGEVAFCSIVYQVLLERHFGGNFESLLAWSRQQRAAGPDMQRDSVGPKATALQRRSGH